MQARLEYLFNCYVQGNLSIGEEEEFMELLAASENKEEVQKLLYKLIDESRLQTRMQPERAAFVLKNILQNDRASLISIDDKRSVFPFAKFAVAASVIVFICVSVFWIISRQDKTQPTVAVIQLKKLAPEVFPGGNHAILTMADGTQIVLDSIKNGEIRSGKATITKKGGLLVYDASALKTSQVVTYNTLSTPAGGQYKVVLADGSEVWLNASSSIRFPTAFKGKYRDVELTGEAYFEVAKNKEKPFHVNVNGMQVEVLGTHFNVNAYDDEGAIKTSLLEGSVKIKKGTVSSLLRPGQQGVLKKNSNNVEVKSADMDEVIAWKNGLFQFDGADIETIMHEVGRWYDVDIEYAGKVPQRRFEGKISRDAQLSDVLKILELSNVKFTVEGKKIIVQ